MTVFQRLLTMLSVRIMHACCVGETESGLGELSRDEDDDPFCLGSSVGRCDVGEDILL